MQRNWQHESRKKRRENRTPAQEMEYKESESARRAELRKRKKVEAAEAKLADEVRENLDFIRSFVFKQEWTIVATVDELLESWCEYGWERTRDGAKKNTRTDYTLQETWERAYCSGVRTYT